MKKGAWAAKKTGLVNFVSLGTQTVAHVKEEKKIKVDKMKRKKQQNKKKKGRQGLPDLSEDRFPTVTQQTCISGTAT